MPEFISVSASSYDPASLASKLTELSSAGWQLVTIVPTGGDLTAFLTRNGGTATGQPAQAASTAAAAFPTAVTTSGPNPVSEPAGWGTAPTTQGYSPSPQPVSQPAAQPSAQPASMVTAAAAPASSSSTPAGWYHDPSGRYELRYWDGAQWTEHVARGGNQYTDPPVA